MSSFPTISSFSPLLNLCPLISLTHTPFASIPILERWSFTYLSSVKAFLSVTTHPLLFPVHPSPNSVPFNSIQTRRAQRRWTEQSSPSPPGFLQKSQSWKEFSDGGSERQGEIQRGWQGDGNNRNNAGQCRAQFDVRCNVRRQLEPDTIIKQGGREIPRSQPGLLRDSPRSAPNRGTLHPTQHPGEAPLQGGPLLRPLGPRTRRQVGPIRRQQAKVVPFCAGPGPGWRNGHSSRPWWWLLRCAWQHGSCVWLDVGWTPSS